MNSKRRVVNAITIPALSESSFSSSTDRASEFSPASSAEEGHVQQYPSKLTIDGGITCSGQ